VGDPADDPAGAVPVQPPVRGDEQRPFAALADGQVDRADGARGERDGDDLAALAGDDQGPVAALQSQVLDVRAGGLRYPQAGEGPLRDQGWGRCGGEFRAEFCQLFVVGADRGQLDVLVAADEVGEGCDLDRQVVVTVR
jgi:hypothetical protein